MKTVTIHGSILPGAGGATALMLERFLDPQTMSIDGQEFKCETIAWQAHVPDNAELIRDSRGIVSLRIAEQSYSANEVFSLAKLKLAGFSLDGELSNVSTG